MFGPCKPLPPHMDLCPTQSERIGNDLQAAPRQKDTVFSQQFYCRSLRLVSVLIQLTSIYKLYRGNFFTFFFTPRIVLHYSGKKVNYRGGGGSVKGLWHHLHISYFSRTFNHLRQLHTAQFRPVSYFTHPHVMHLLGLPQLRGTLRLEQC